MEELDLRRYLDQVTAPPGFEGRVLANLASRKEKRRRRERIFRLAFAGGAAVALVAVLITNAPFLQKSAPVIASKLSGPAAENESLRGTAFRSLDVIPVMETVDYADEVKHLSYEPETVYKLEQVSEAALTEIKY